MSNREHNEISQPESTSPTHLPEEMSPLGDLEFIEQTLYEFDQPLQDPLLKREDTLFSGQDDSMQDGNINLVRLYISQADKTPRLTSDEEIQIGTRVQAGKRAQAELTTPDISDQRQKELQGIVEDANQARAHFINANLRLAYAIAKRHRHLINEDAFPDLIQAANIGIMKAVDKFDPEKGFLFNTYGVWWARREVLDHVAKYGKTNRLSIAVHNGVNKLRKIEATFERIHGVEPDIETLRDLYNQAKKEQNAPFEKVIEVIDTKRAIQPVSLTTPVTDTDGGDLFLSDIIPDETVPVEDQALDNAFKNMLSHTLEGKIRSCLKPHEWETIRLKFLETPEPRTLAEVGEILGMTRQAVQEREKKAFQKLRLALNAEHFE